MFTETKCEGNDLKCCFLLVNRTFDFNKLRAIAEMNITEYAHKQTPLRTEPSLQASQPEWAAKSFPIRFSINDAVFNDGHFFSRDLKKENSIEVIQVAKLQGTMEEGKEGAQRTRARRPGRKNVSSSYT